MEIYKYASIRNGKNAHEWEYNQDREKVRYGRLLFVKQGKILLQKKESKPWKLPGTEVGHMTDHDEILSEWSHENLGIRIDLFEPPLGLYTIGLQRSITSPRECRETIVQIPSFWREEIELMEEKMKSSDRELEWFPIKKLPRNTSFATRDFLEDYAPSKKHQTRPIYQGGGVAA